MAVVSLTWFHKKKKAAYVVLFVMQLHNPQNGKSQKCLRHSQLYASTMRSIESNIMAFIRQQQPFRHTKHHRYERIGIATVHWQEIAHSTTWSSCGGAVFFFQGSWEPLFLSRVRIICRRCWKRWGSTQYGDRTKKALTRYVLLVSTAEVAHPSGNISILSIHRSSLAHRQKETRGAGRKTTGRPGCYRLGGWTTQMSYEPTVGMRLIMYDLQTLFCNWRGKWQ